MKGIGAQIHQDLVEMAGIGQDDTGVRIDIFFDGYSCRE
jgi:hypothetical protein